MKGSFSGNLTYFSEIVFSGALISQVKHLADENRI